MLKYKGTRHFLRTVKVRVPSETTPDTMEDASFVARFKALKRSELEALQNPDPKGREKAVEAVLAEHADLPRAELATKIVEAVANYKGKNDDRAFLTNILVGVDGIGDENGDPIPSSTARDMVIEDLALCAAAVETFNEQYRQAKAGN